MNLRNNIFFRNFREWLTLSALIFAFFYLTGDTSGHSDRFANTNGSTQIVLESSDNPETQSKDVSGNKKSENESSSWIIAIDFASLYGNNEKHSVNDNSQIVKETPVVSSGYQKDSKNTLSLVNSDLASQFTLLGEKPSGTS